MTEQAHTPKNYDALSEEQRKWLQIAEPEFHRKHLDLANYLVGILEEKESVVVFLNAADAPRGTRGSGGSHPGYEVEISRKDLKIIRSNYVR